MDDLDKATDSALGSGIRDNREKIKVDELIARYPNGVTIVAFEMCEGKKGSFPVFAIAEESSYFSAGGDMKNLADTWLSVTEGDLNRINEWLTAKPMKFKISKVPTKNGNTYTKAVRVREKRVVPEVDNEDRLF